MEPNGPSSPLAPPREQLAAAECLRLLASVPVGRIVYTRRAMPAVELVNFAIQGGDIVIRTDAGGPLAAATHHTVVAFEADEVDAATGRWWSVMLVGWSQEVTDPRDIARLRDIGLRLLEPGGQEHFIRVTPGIVSGHRLAG
jgi:nitroimidazol reductase NimA-like FMN-containing flavoprotein (pyridoxamine 5'-phosphate oxidase superfamily)